MKGKPFKEKLAFYWEYYRLPVIVGVLLVAFLIYTDISLTLRKDTVFLGAFVNANEGDQAKAYMTAFAEKAGVDGKKQEILADVSLTVVFSEKIPESTFYSIQSIQSMIAAHEIDCMLADRDAFVFLAYSDYLGDLREFMSEEDFAAFGKDLFYVDAALFPDGSEKSESHEAADKETVWPTDPAGEPWPQTASGLIYPDPSKPERMTDPVPVGIFLSERTKAFDEAFRFTYGDPVAGIASTSRRGGISADFIRYVLGISEGKGQ